MTNQTLSKALQKKIKAQIDDWIAEDYPFGSKGLAIAISRIFDKEIKRALESVVPKEIQGRGIDVDYNEGWDNCVDEIKSNIKKYL